jgi:hypothetical protein
MLTLCQEATVVNPGKRLHAIAKEQGWTVMSLPRPWKHRWHRLWHRWFYLIGSDRIGPPHRIAR